ncbi:MAG TPA: hypothetical protein VLA43_05565, partial [Longimicrobiales bacterium]|nr:hypothetical protein [Longimicrobiales bacterium]
MTRARPRFPGAFRSLSLGLALAAVAGCRTEELPVPGSEEAAEYYAAVTDLTVEMSGNVAEVTVVQSAAQLRRGGALWARVGPYIYLFSDATRSLFT